MKSNTALAGKLHSEILMVHEKVYSGVLEDIISLNNSGMFLDFIKKADNLQPEAKEKLKILTSTDCPVIFNNTLSDIIFDMILKEVPAISV